MINTADAPAAAKGPLDAAFEEARSLCAPLSERLSLFAERHRAVRPQSAEAYDRLVERLEQARAGTGAPMPGQRLPPFALPDDSGHLVTLDDLLRDGPLVVSFNRGHWCQYCGLELTALKDIEAEVQQLGGRIVAIVPERREYAEALRRILGLPFGVLIDLDLAYAASLNLAIWVGSELKELYGVWGIDLARLQGNEGALLPIPATFVLDADGRILARQVDPDFRRRMPTEEILAALRSTRRRRSAAL